MSEKAIENYSLTHWFKRAAIDSLPAVLAYFPIGIVWGILWKQAALPYFLGIAFSFFVYAGAVQFILLSLLIAKASILSIFIAIFPVAIRNSFYTISALNFLPKKALARMYLAFGLVDATFAILISKPKEQAQNPRYSLWLNVIIHLSWTIGTAAGLSFASYLPKEISCLSFSLPALLVVLALEQYLKVKSVKLVIIPLAAFILNWTVFGNSWLIPSLMICSFFSLLSPKKAGAN